MDKIGAIESVYINQLEPNLFRFLDSNGDGTGSNDAIGDYRDDPIEFYISGIQGKIILINRIIIHVGASGSFKAERYGANENLSKGIFIKKMIADNVLLDITGGDPVKKNTDWAKMCFDVNTSSFGGGSNFLTARWTFTKAGGAIRINEGERFSVILNDKYTKLTSQHFKVEGTIINE